MEPLGDSLGGNEGQPPSQARPDQDDRTVSEAVDHSESVLHPGGEGQLDGVPHRLARALVVEDHAGEAVHIAVPEGMLGLYN